MPPRPSFPWLPPTAWPYRIFLGLWVILYAGFFAYGTFAAYQQDLPISRLATVGVLCPLVAAAITVWFAPRIGWFLALLGIAALGWRLFRTLGFPAGLVIGALAHIPVLAGLPLGWLEQRRNAARPSSAPQHPKRQV